MQAYKKVLLEGWNYNTLNFEKAKKKGNILICYIHFQNYLQFIVVYSSHLIGFSNIF